MKIQPNQKHPLVEGALGANENARLAKLDKTRANLEIRCAPKALTHHRKVRVAARTFLLKVYARALAPAGRLVRALLRR